MRNISVAFFSIAIDRTCYAIDRNMSCDRSHFRLFTLCIVSRQVAIDHTLSGDRSHRVKSLFYDRAIDRTLWTIDRILFLHYKNRFSPFHLGTFLFKALAKIVSVKVLDIE